MKPILFSTPMVQAILAGRKTQTRRVCKPLNLNYPMRAYEGETPEEWLSRWNNKPPYQPGDVLWVRETWCEITKGIGFNAYTEYGYKADFKYLPRDVKWRPSIFMPRDAARIFLRVTDVRVERVQDISENDAVSEGVNNIIDWIAERITGKTKFQRLWDHINAKRGFGWDSNPWVWVISFEKIEQVEAERGAADER